MDKQEFSRRTENDVIIFSDTSGDFFTIKEAAADGVAEIAIAGELRASVAPSLESELTMLISFGMSIRLELSGLKYISSAGQQVLKTTELTLEKLDNGTELTLTKVPNEILAALKSNGLHQLLMIE